LAGRIDRAKKKREVLVTGPFAATSSRVTAAGALLVGDAAEFFDPFTGEGILSALAGAELAIASVGPALARTGKGPRRGTRRVPVRRRDRFRRIVGGRAAGRLGDAPPRPVRRAVRNLGARDLGHIFIGVTGDILPARAVLSPAFLLRMML